MWAMTKSDHDELTAYRRLGLSPDEIAAKLDYLNDPAPAPLQFPLDEDGFSLGQGLLEDDGYDPAMGGAAGTRLPHAMRISRGSGWCPYCQLDGWHWRGCPEAPENEDETGERDPMETDPEERGMTCPG